MAVWLAMAVKEWMEDIEHNIENRMWFYKLTFSWSL